jgi:hypothetical protein
MRRHRSFSPNKGDHVVQRQCSAEPGRYFVVSSIAVGAASTDELGLTKGRDGSRNDCVRVGHKCLRIAATVSVVIVAVLYFSIDSPGFRKVLLSTMAALCSASSIAISWSVSPSLWRRHESLRTISS